MLADPLIGRQQLGEPAGVALERLHGRRDGGGVDEGGCELDERGPFGVGEPVGGPGDRVDVAGRHDTGGERVVQFGHRHADRAPLHDRFGVTRPAPPTAGEHLDGAAAAERGGEIGLERIEPCTVRERELCEFGDSSLIARRQIGCGQRGRRCDGTQRNMRLDLIVRTFESQERNRRKLQVRPVAGRHPPPTSRASSTTAPQRRSDRRTERTCQDGRCATTDVGHRCGPRGVRDDVRLR